MRRIEACIFDLSGVLVDTARLHFQAWRRLARSLDIVLTAVGIGSHELLGAARLVMPGLAGVGAAELLNMIDAL